jgi:hypothetical protein
MRRIFRFTSALIIVAATLCFFAGPAEPATLHAILVGDTVDPNIGRGDKLDLDLMSALLRDAAKNTGMKLNLRVFEDRIIRSQIMSAVQALRPESNDTVVFFYTGHGYRTSAFRDKWPAFALKSESGGSAGLDQKWVYNELKDKGARLLIVMADACNSVISEGAIDTRLALRSGKELPDSYKKLFLEARGNILASSSIPGQYSYSGDRGSQFTVAFIESVRKALTTASPAWEPIMKESTRPLYGGQQQPQYAMNDAAGTPGEGGDRGSSDGDGGSSEPSGGGEVSLGLGNLLVEMESQIEYSAQTGQWPGMREKWMQGAYGAGSSVGKMRDALIAFEKNMKPGSMKGDWSSRKPAWTSSLRAASSIGQLAQPLLDVEAAVSESAFSGQWSGQRAQWQQKVRGFGGSSGGPSGGDDTSGDGEAPSPGGGGSFGRLLIQLDGSMTGAAMEQAWSGKRNQWQSEVKSAGDSVARLRELVVTFETNIRFDAQESYWRNRRGDWVKRTRSARGMDDLKQLLVEVESSIKYSAQVESWREERPNWLRQVEGL